MQRKPDHIYSEAVATKLTAISDNYLTSTQTRLYGSHAAVTKYLDETKQLQTELKNLDIKFSTPYPQMVGPALSGAFFLYMLSYEREPWKILVLLTAVTAMIYKFLQQPGKHQRAQSIKAELTDRNRQMQQAESALQITQRSQKNHTVTLTADLTPEIKISRTHDFRNWLENASAKEVAENEESVLLARVIASLRK